MVRETGDEGLKEEKEMEDRPKMIDTIVIIGNGFDRWLGLNTSYSDFHKYYSDHRDELVKKKHRMEFEDGTIEEFTDVELIYGDPLDPGELDDDFWNGFEQSLSHIDSERLNLFFGKEKSGLKRMNKSIKKAKKILAKAFCGWIQSLSIEPRESAYDFGNNCLFINFNYTDTLHKCLGVKEEFEYHIHGQADDSESIIFGHNEHPHEPEEMLYRLGGRFRGLYYVDNILYETDKHCADNIQLLIMFLASHGVMKEEIEDIYVLGQSMSPVDLEYFAFLMDATKVESESEDRAAVESDPMDDLHNRMQYAINTVGYGVQASEEETDAVERRFRQEQNARNDLFRKEFFKMIGKKKATKAEQVEVEPRKADAKWHISYHGDKDKAWKEIVMKEFKCTNYELVGSIDECIGKFGKESIDKT